MLSNIYGLSLGLALLSALTQAVPNPAAQKSGGVQNGKAIYFLTNDKQNAVVALPIASDGTLGKGTVTPTGDSGGHSISANLDTGIDALISQSALTIVGNYIFAVNAGSNTVSMLAISSSDPTKLSVVGKSAPVMGEFPTTVAASAKNSLVCVGSTGQKSGISCGTFTNKGIGQMDALRPFNLNQSTPPAGPLNTVSQTFFSSDEKMLFTTVKGDPTVNNTGFFSVFNVKGSGCGSSLSRTEKRSSPNGTAVLFGSALIPQTNNVFVTDASFGAAVLSVQSDNSAQTVGKGVIDGQKATCWATVSAVTNSAFVTDVAVDRIIEMSLKDASIISTIDLTSTSKQPGYIDLKAAGNFVYILAPGNTTAAPAVTVLDVSKGQGKGKFLQEFQLASMGVDSNAQGMAVLV